MAIVSVPILDTEKIVAVRGVKSDVPGCVTPEDFAATGDGRTDDTAAIQLAINAIRLAGKGTLMLGPKPYRCNRLDLDKQSYLVFIGGIIDPDLQLLFRFDPAKQ